MKLGFIYLTKNEYKRNILEGLKRDLEYTEIDYYSHNVIKWKFYFENEKHLLVPRNYNSVKIAPILNNYTDMTTEGQDINIEMTSCATPRDPEQQKAVDFIKNNKTGIIKAYTGFGKTWCAIKSITEIKKKTMIVVNKNKLLTQWIDEITKFTNLTKDDIGIISGRDSVKKALNKPIILAIVQTLGFLHEDKIYPENNEYLQMFIDANIGLTILDEVHRTSTTPHFTKASLFYVSKKIFGLSATPKKQSEKLTEILQMYFSKNIFIPDEANRLKPKVNVILYNSNIPQKTWRYIMFNYQFNYVRYRNTLLKMPVYRRLLTNIFTKINQHEETKGILFSAHEIKFLKSIQELLSENDMNDTGVIYADSDESEKEKRILLATYKTVVEGLSIKHLNRLIVGTPISSDTSVEQLAGRITRDHNDKKHNPEIYDLVDVSHRIPRKSFLKRLETYNKLNLEMNAFVGYESNSESFYLVDDNELKKTFPELT